MLRKASAVRLVAILHINGGTNGRGKEEDEICSEAPEHCCKESSCCQRSANHRALSRADCGTRSEILGGTRLAGWLRRTRLAARRREVAGHSLVMIGLETALLVRY